MCCFTGNTKIIYSYNDTKSISTFQKLSTKNYDFVYVPIYGKWEKAKVIKIPYNGMFYRIRLRNGVEITTTDNHINVTNNGNKESKELCTDDYIEFSNGNIDFIGYGSYDLGLFVGLYLAEGSHLGDDAIQLTIGETELDIVEFVSNFVGNNFATHCSVCPGTGKSLTIAISDVVVRKFIDSLVSGTALTKKLVFWDKLSRDMLRGIFDGWFWGDGKKNGSEAYTCSKELAEQMLFIGRIIGKLLNIRETNRVTSFGEKSYNSTLYSLHVCVNSDNGGRIYISKNNKLYVKIESIDIVPNANKVAFCFEMMGAEPYFELPSGLVTHNCRLRLDRKQLTRRSGGLFAASALTGSVGVVTINIPRIACKAQSIEEFYTMLSEVMELAKESLEVKRVLIEDLTGKGLYPYSTHYLDGVYAAHKKYWYNHFSTIGLVGMNEACLNLLGVSIESNVGKEFSEEVLRFMLDRITEYQNETGNLYNLEASPCESATFRMAKCDKKLYPDIITAGTSQTPFYTNSTQLPVDTGFDIIDVLDHQNSLQRMYTGGTVVHLLLGESVNSWETVRNFVKMVATQYELPYFTITPTFSVCKNHGYINGEVYECLQCNEKTEVYSRVVGYLRPISNWNDAKQLEFKERSTYKL
ncbi:MAG: anaerobic ribonucleoside-triphosphate reductase [Candidatus Paceibacterota bacterium]